MSDGNTASNLTSQMATLNITLNYTSPSIAQDVTVHSPGQITEVDALYKAIAQGIFFLCLSTVVGGVMVLFICLNIIQECKVYYNIVIATIIATVIATVISTVIATVIAISSATVTTTLTATVNATLTATVNRYNNRYHNHYLTATITATVTG